MNDEEERRLNVESGSLEQSDARESLRQLWWTIAVTVGGIGLLAYFTL